MVMINYKQRMYCIAMRHLSGIQKGIQSAHAIGEYSARFGTNQNYQKWLKRDKTLIILEANTTDDLVYVVTKLNSLHHPVMHFNEPDLRNVITAVAFVLNEPIWNQIDYPEPRDNKVAAIRELIAPFRLASN